MSSILPVRASICLEVLHECSYTLRPMLRVERLAANVSRLRPHLVKCPSSASPLAARSYSIARATMSQQPAETAVQKDSKSLDGFLRCIAACNQGAEQQRELVPLYIEDACIGYVRPRRVIVAHPSPFFQCSNLNSATSRALIASKLGTGTIRCRPLNLHALYATLV